MTKCLRPFLSVEHSAVTTLRVIDECPNNALLERKKNCGRRQRSPNELQYVLLSVIRTLIPFLLSSIGHEISVPPLVVEQTTLTFAVAHKMYAERVIGHRHFLANVSALTARTRKSIVRTLCRHIYHYLLVLLGEKEKRTVALSSAVAMRTSC